MNDINKFLEELDKKYKEVTNVKEVGQYEDSFLDRYEQDGLELNLREETGKKINKDDLQKGGDYNKFTELYNNDDYLNKLTPVDHNINLMLRRIHNKYLGFNDLILEAEEAEDRPNRLVRCVV